jgi:cation-transporting ATPase E
MRSHDRVDGAGITAMNPSGAGVLAADLDGLTTEQAVARLAAGRANSAPPSPGRTTLQILRANLLTRFNAILGSLLVVVAVVGPLQDGLFGIVLVSNAAIGIVQELRTKRSLDRLAILTAPRARVVRDGVPSEIRLDQVVVDDVLQLSPGDQVPVDGVIVTTRGMDLDEALLTGESTPVSKETGGTVLSGSFVTSGAGTIRATAVGAGAYAARLEAQARRFRLIRSELQQGTNWILRLVTWVMVPSGSLLVVSELLRTHQSMADALRGSVAGVGAMVPEGLVLLTSIAFAVGALRLSRRRVLVQELAAIEGLARVDVLCIDKTGTLTDAHLSLDSLEVVAQKTEEQADAALGAIVANEPAPNATLRAIASAGARDPGWVLSDLVPFSSSRQWSAYVFEGAGTWVLGAPERLGLPLSERDAGSLRAHQEAGRRVLLLASSDRPPRLGPDGEHLPPGLRPAALLVFAEQLRPEANSIVRYLVDQGITIKVLSGDSPATVGAVGRAAGVPSDSAPQDASELGTEAALRRALGTTSLLGRVRPEQKLSAVRALQDQGHVVAMVGDGVNDVQALKQADLGIAMGAGSQSSRAVARIVLLDNDFAAVPHILAEGRKVIANIERVANLFVTKTAYAVVLAAVVIVGGTPFPFFPRHLTVVTTFTIGVPGFFLALASGEPRAKPGFARRILRFAIPTGAAAAASCFAAYAICRATPHTTAAESRTAATMALLAVGLWVLGLVSRPLSPSRLLLVAGMLLGAGLVFALPVFHRVLGIQIPPVSVLLESAAAVAASIAVLTVLQSVTRSLRPGDGRPRPGSGRGARTAGSPSPG